jgi:hypothetical protein
VQSHLSSSLEAAKAFVEHVVSPLVLGDKEEPKDKRKEVKEVKGTLL